MKIHYLQHVPFEDPANILVWAENRGHTVSKTLLYDGAVLPPMDDFDWLVIMGGPMNIYEEESHPWLVEEKKFIEQAISGGKTVLGICLGAQLIADILGGRVYKNKYKEIGWYPVALTGEAKNSPVFGALPDKFTAFHWHGDTFDLPPGAVRVAESEGCANQGFEYDGRVIGLQFHLESSLESIKRLIRHCSAELVEGKYIQNPAEMLSQNGNLAEIRGVMNLLLDNMRGAGRECPIRNPREHALDLKGER